MIQKFFVLALLVQSTAGMAGIYDQLTPDQQNRVQRGEQVMVVEEIEDSYWPKVTIYQRLDATPEEALAVLSDYELQRTYMPDMTQSKVSRQVDLATTLVDYEVEAPILFFSITVSYSLQNKVSTYDSGRGYRLDWSMTQSDRLLSVDGSSRFEPLGTGTIMAYENRTVADTDMGKDRMLEGMRKGAGGAGKMAEAERRSNPQLLAKQIERLRIALGQMRQSQCLW